jgi:hypothetical protein
VPEAAGTLLAAGQGAVLFQSNLFCVKVLGFLGMTAANFEMIKGRIGSGGISDQGNDFASVNRSEEVRRRATLAASPIAENRVERYNHPIGIFQTVV